MHMGDLLCAQPTCIIWTIAIFEFEIKLHETDLRQVREVKCGGGFSVDAPA